jgi:hypothetical protein
VVRLRLIEKSGRASSDSESGKSMTAKFFDHAVLPVESLEASRDRYQALGFTVAPDARHPFGTENACVFFNDGTYLEPLAIGQREDCEATAIDGNMFTAVDQAYRFRNGENGFSALGFVCDDAAADRQIFKSKGILAGENLNFSRLYKTPEGAEEEGSFELVFTRDLRAPDITLFACQNIKAPKIDKTALKNHANGVTGIKEVILSEFVPSDFQYYLQPVIGNRDTPSHSFGMEISASNVNFNVLTPEGLKVMFGASRQSLERGLRCEGIVLAVEDRAKLEKALAKGGVKPRDMGRYLVVDPAPGQGAFLAFDVSEI